jgi:hypothetical protein
MSRSITRVDAELPGFYERLNVRVSLYSTCSMPLNDITQRRRLEPRRILDLECLPRDIKRGRLL